MVFYIPFACVSALNQYWFMALLYDLPISGAISVWEEAFGVRKSCTMAM